MNIKAIIPEYVKTDHFLIKIFQIFCGLIVHSRIECLKWEGLCFKEGFSSKSFFEIETQTRKILAEI
uniref:Uncharacterized protein n=1 Tax=Meloidogyne enterolobii TaxID=390850 RepID=A0A6V7W7A0_MELEN|nr:unnamed protein product [Meloidogyne enterolobii]